MDSDLENTRFSSASGETRRCCVKDANMKLKPKLVPNWPKLAWVARCPRDHREITVYHGWCVETNPEWCVEAVWAGDFRQGDFDRTDLIFGSGVRCRDEKIVFVPAGTSCDRLCHSRKEGVLYVSNSLPALLAVADLSLITEYRYDRDIRTICNGLGQYVRRLPTTTTDVHLQYFHNLEYDGSELRELVKPDGASRFKTFADYEGFLLKTAELLAANMNAPGRVHQVHSMTSISSGYDASATAVLVRQAGCTRAVTLRQSNSHWRGTDSGAPLADRIGMECTEYNRRVRHYPHEESVWAATGRPSSLNWTQFDFPEPLCLFFSGCRGDVVWDREAQPLEDPFVVPSVGDLGICEYRLQQGMFHCVVPSWGLRHLDEIRAISQRPEMAPWTMGSTYDRPIPRRIVEEAGVPRHSFAQRKRNTSVETSFAWPHSTAAISSYHRYLRDQGRPVPPRWIVPVFRKIAAVDKLIYMNFTSKLRLWDLGLRWRLLSKKNSLFFHWGNNELKRKYRQGLDAFKTQESVNVN